jgi:hypothetical protein
LKGSSTVRKVERIINNNNGSTAFATEHTCGMPNANNAPNNVAACFVLMHDITDVNDLAVFQPKDVSKMIKLWNMDAANNTKLGMGIQKKVEALIWWSVNQGCCGLAISMDCTSVDGCLTRYGNQQKFEKSSSIK